MLFGLCTISNKEMDVLDVIDAAVDAGYDGVEVWGGDHVSNDKDAECTAIRERVETHELSIPVYGSYLRPGTDAFADQLTHELEVAVTLGADLVRVWAGNQEWQDHHDHHLDAVVADLREAADSAAERNLAITVEKHEGTLTNTTEGARRVIERVSHPHCGLNYQPLFGMNAATIASESRELAPISNNVHLQAVPEQGGRKRCLLANAFYDVGTVIRVFQDAGFDGFANVEFVTDDLPYSKAIAHDRAYLRSVV
ncbi:Sugar phosphate isomerase/epimerase [Halogranum amylolyticum]|uniref:Sugar phosphate isomerase/epimerase n=1 Tax=Halogranum amylolyticum TaxID=660520 RepID=A0A1H8UJR3_9EURY|nr:sugar phosphate isomerase/epimerase family protein [Halogranum amylolyticum]SEP02838.1 Sugar phosphate isomerase/epimerase [Halogranum amylolyticum]